MIEHHFLFFWIQAISFCADHCGSWDPGWWGSYGSGKMDIGQVDSPDCEEQHRTTLGCTHPAKSGHHLGGEGRGVAEELAT